MLAQENIFPNIAEREIAYTQWPESMDPPDYMVFDVQDYLFYHEPVGQTMKDAVLGLLGTGEYGLYTNVNGFMILKKGYEGPKTVSSPLLVRLDFSEARKAFVSFEDSFPEIKFFIPSWVEVKGDHLLIEKGIRGSVWWGPWVTFPRGIIP